MKTIALLVLPLSACIFEQEVYHPTPLAEFAELDLDISATSRYLRVGIYYDEAARGCLSLSSSFEATIAGVPLPVGFEGGEEDGICDNPVLLLEAPPAVATAELVLRDDSLTVTATIEDALLPRTATLVPDGPWTFTVDQNVVVAWSPASDLAKYGPEVWLKHEDRVFFFESTVESDELHFAVSNIYPPVPVGSSTLEIMMNHAPDTQPCTNATCSLATDRTITKDVTVQ